MNCFTFQSEKPEHREHCIHQVAAPVQTGRYRYISGFCTSCKLPVLKRLCKLPLTQTGQLGRRCSRLVVTPEGSDRHRPRDACADDYARYSAVSRIRTKYVFGAKRQLTLRLVKGAAALNLQADSQMSFLCSDSVDAVHTEVF